MTVGQAIVNWLYTFGNIEINPAIVIETDQLDSDAGSYGLYKQATKSTTPYIDGSSDNSEYYYLMVRQPSKTNAVRVDNQAWMEELERWIYEQNIKRNLPELDAPKDCYGISVSVSGYMMETETDTAAYQISLKIDYTEGK